MKIVGPLLSLQLHMCRFIDSFFYHFIFNLSLSRISNLSSYVPPGINHRHSNSGPPFYPHLVPPAIMVWIFVWKYIFEPFIHILQHFVLPRLWYGSLSESISLNHLSIFYNISSFGPSRDYGMDLCLEVYL